MQRIQQGTTSTITFIKYTDVHTAEEGYFSDKILDAVVVQDNDDSKYIHKTSSDISITSDGAAISFTLLPTETAFMIGYANIEVRDTTSNNPVTIFQSIRSIDFLKNKIHTITV